MIDVDYHDLVKETKWAARGSTGGNYMYHWIEDKEFLGKMRALCADIVNQLVQQINNDGHMWVEAHLVGSGAKNMIAQNANEPVDLDYNLCILENYAFDANDGRRIKPYIQEQFNAVLQKNGWGDCQDSTSALTTERRYFTKGNHTEFSIDLAIVQERNNSWYRLIHQKTGIVQLDQWYWNEAPHSHGLDRRVDILKENDLWLKVRDAYLEKKNMYLSRQDHDHPSFIVYIEAVNEVYCKYFNR